MIYIIVFFLTIMLVSGNWLNLILGKKQKDESQLSEIKDDIKTEIEQLNNIKDIEQELRRNYEEGIRIAVGGKTGRGKSTTINRIFGLNLPVDPNIPATTKVYQVKNPPIGGTKVHIPVEVFDMPGLDDGRAGTEENFFEKYEGVIPQMDVILWVLSAFDRAYGRDIQYISKLIELFPEITPRIVIGINNYDRISPNDWTPLNQPSKKQQENMDIQIREVKKWVHDQCGLKSEAIVPYAAEKYWGLETLFNRLIKACSSDKQLILGTLKLDYFDLFISEVHPKFQEKVQAEYDKKKENLKNAK